MSERPLITLPPDLQPVHGLLTLLVLIGMGKTVGEQISAMSLEERFKAPPMELDLHLFYQGMTAALGLATGFLGDNKEFRDKLNIYFVTMSSQMDPADVEHFIAGMESVEAITAMAKAQEEAAEATAEALATASKH